MKPKTNRSPESVVREIKRKTRRIFNPEEKISINGINMNAFVVDGPEEKIVVINGIPYLVEDALTLRTVKKRSGKNIPTAVTPVTPSVVISVLVKAEDTVKKGQGVIVLSAMKMETTLTAPFDGTVTAVNVAEGESVFPGQILVDIQGLEAEPRIVRPNEKNRL